MRIALPVALVAVGVFVLAVWTGESLADVGAVVLIAGGLAMLVASMLRGARRRSIRVRSGDREPREADARRRERTPRGVQAHARPHRDAGPQRRR